jgi:Uma2 family endonuclease
MCMNRLWPSEDRTLTVDDLVREPEDGNRYELADGILQVMPPPLFGHQRVLSRLVVLLALACPAGFEAVMTPRVSLASDLRRVPDFAVFSQSHPADSAVAEPPRLVVEVSSRSTANLDRTTKKREYAAAGVESYWIVTSYGDRPSLRAFELTGKRYDQVDLATGDESFEASRPFPVTVVPRMLVADGTAWRSLLR